jgi:PAS domain S-box-containing protein
MPNELEPSILDAIVAGIVVIGPDDLIEDWNLWMATASGKSAADAIGKSLRDVFPQAELGALARATVAARDSGVSTLLTNALHPALLPLKTRAGLDLAHDVMVSPSGNAPHRKCLVQIADVTNAARRERFLRDRQNARYYALVESAPDVIFNLDSAGIIRLANPSASQHFGYSTEELIGTPMAGLFETNSHWFEIWRGLGREQAASRPVEVTMRRKDGARRYFEASFARWHDGTRAFTTAILRDTTDRRAAETALRESDKKARADARTLEELNEVLLASGKALNEADQRKDEFLATLAHELRNPLAPLRNGLQLLKLAKNDRALIERTRHMMEMQLGQMVRLIDDLMDVSRINKDLIELNKEPTSLDKLLRQAVETSGPLIDAQQHKLTIDIPQEEIALEADSVRLTQVFANLLNNAAKYTPMHGRIAIKVEPAEDWVVVRVIDNGVGIPKEMLSKVFDLFTQVDRSLERSQGGLGIGLSLVKRLVGMHEGTVEAHSNGIGTGSEFVVRLPIVHRPAQQASAHEAQEAPGAQDGRRILIVDDNSDSADSLATILSMLGHTTKTANDGFRALEVAEDFLPDVVLLDIGMPRLNGYETARRMRQRPWGQAAVLVALTGWGQDDDRRKSSEAGFDTHLVKPIEVTEIIRLLEQSDETA